MLYLSKKKSCNNVFNSFFLEKLSSKPSMPKFNTDIRLQGAQILGNHSNVASYVCL